MGSFEHKASKALLLAAVIAELVVLSELELLVVFGNWLAGVFMLSKQTSQITRVFFVLDERINLCVEENFAIVLPVYLFFSSDKLRVLCEKMSGKVVEYVLVLEDVSVRSINF